MRVVLLLISMIAMPTWAESPRQVLQSLLENLRTNGDDNAGISAVFDRAAPANQAMTGPLPRFIQMVSSHPYGELLNHQSAVVGQPRVEQNLQSFPIRLISKQGYAMGYVWTLEEQADERWLTTSVVPVAVNGQGL